MANIRNDIEKGFEKFAGVLFDNKYKTLIIVFALFSFILSHLPMITIDTSTEGFLSKDSPVLKKYDDFRNQFGRDEFIIIAIKPPEVFNMDFLKKLKKLHYELKENVPFTEDINSLINARNTTGTADELRVEELFEKFPESTEKLQKKKELALSNPMYKNLLVSEDGTFTTIVIKTQTYTTEENENSDTTLEDDFADEPEENTQLDGITNNGIKYLTLKEEGMVADAVHDIVDKYRSDDFQIYLAGSTMVTHHLKASMLSDMRTFFIAALFFISLFLFLMFRRITGFVLPLFIVVLSLLSTISIMAWNGTSLKLPTQILPSFILAVGVGAVVHILVIFFRHFDANEDKKSAISHAIGHSGLAVLMTSLTTASGLLSFSTAEVAPIADLGIFAAAGVMISFLFTLILLPALLSIIPLKPKTQSSEASNKKKKIDVILDFFGELSTTHPKKILATTFIIICISFIGILKVEFHHNVLGWFPEDSHIRISTEMVNKELKGSITLEIVFDTGVENGLYNPEILKKFEESVIYLESLDTGIIFGGKAISFSAMIKEINKALHEGQESYYKIPDTRAIIANEIVLFENTGSDDLEDFVDSQFQKARFTLKVPWEDAIAYNEFLNLVNKHLEENYSHIDVCLTGMMALLSQTVSDAIISLRNSYLTASIVITIFMIILIGQFRIGLLSMIPNFVPILITIGIMGWLKMDMDLFTMLVGSIALGLAVDDTVHFMHNFRRYYEQ